MYNPYTSDKETRDNSKGCAGIFLSLVHLRLPQQNHAFIYEFVFRKPILEIE